MTTSPTRHRGLRSLMVAWALLAWACVAAHAAALVTTPSGLLQGRALDRVDAFLGIPYAQPPTGEWRWRAPRPAPSWQGTRQALAFGPACPQVPSPYATPTISEDCLSLNVYAPQGSQATPRPVIVWLHPGSLAMGSGSDYDGQHLARQANAIVVTINYRLAALGFLSSAESQQEAATANYGLQDQQLALKWVQSHIAAFGGDPGRVTLMGQSAGAISGCIHMVSPLSAGLFHRAILQSGPCVRIGGQTAAQARTQGDVLATQLNCPSGPGQLACLRGKSVQELLAVAPDGLDALRTPNPWLPVIDGTLIPRKVTDMVRDGEVHPVPVLVGVTADEGRFFVAHSYHRKLGRAMNEEDYKLSAAVMTGSTTSGTLSRALYTTSQYGSHDLAMAAMMTDAGFACPALTDATRLSRKVPVFAYEFTDATAPAPHDPFFDWKAYHTAELQYLFGVPVFVTDVTQPLTPAQKVLSEQMVRYWAAFAATGNPNGPGLPVWPRFQEWSTPFMNLTPGPLGIKALGAFQQSHRCMTWSIMFFLGGQS